MEIIDIPSQLQKVLSYSGRSWKSSIISVLFAVFAAGIVFDLLYSFFYARIYNVEHAHYGRWYWVGIGSISLIICVAFGCASFWRWLFRGRPFKKDKFGVAIAPFEVACVHVDNMSTSDKLRALDEAMQQFFSASQQLVDEEEWASTFEFRLLPSYMRVRSTRDARIKFESLGATLLIWGQLIQEDRLRIGLRLTGVELDMSITGPVSTFYMSSSLKLWSLLAAVTALKRKGSYREAGRYLELAIAPARDIDRSVEGNIRGQAGPTEKLLEQIRAGLPGPASPSVGASAASG